MTEQKISLKQRTTQKTEKHEIKLLTAALKSNKNHRVFYIPFETKFHENVGFSDTGAVQFSEKEFRKILTARKDQILPELPPFTFKIPIANDKNVPGRKQVALEFLKAGKEFEEIYSFTNNGKHFNWHAFPRKQLSDSRY